MSTKILLWLKIKLGITDSFDLKKKTVLWVGLGLGFIGLSSLFFLIIWIYQDGNIFHWGTNIDVPLASNVGQFIGGFVGVFLSGAGFLLIYSTFLEQEKFNANQDDFNIKLLNLIESQNKLTDKQQFESTFFNMINTYRSLLETINGEIDIKCDRHLKHYKGYEYFSAALTQIRNNYRTDAFISFISTNNSSILSSSN